MICLLLFICSLQIISYAQNIDYVWPFGYACCQYPGFGAVNMDFTSGNPAFISVQRHQNLNSTTGSACDSLGNLLFTSNGYYVANALDDTMQNGSDLNPSYYTGQHISNGLTLPQGNLVIPSLTNPDQYLLFHNTIDDYFNTGASLYLYFTIIDMSLNGGLGEVLNKNSVLLNDSMVPGRITATRHANGRDWWIVVHEINSVNLIEFLYTPNGFYGPYYKSLVSTRYFYIGQCGFNQQGNRFAYFVKDTGLEIADFDRCTGDFSNVTQHAIIDSASYGAGIAFSPSGRFLYVCTVENLYQYDLWSSNVDSSRKTVGVYDNFYDTVTTNNPTAFWLLALAPDGKIYMSCGNSSPSLHVINSPDSMGMVCDFQQHTILLPVVNAFTMPNFPNYRLGREIGSICDSLSNDVPKLFQENLITIYPNPSNDNVIIRYELKSSGDLMIYDQLGKEVYRMQLENDKKEMVLDVSGFRNGIYSCRFTIEKKTEVKPLFVLH